MELSKYIKSESAEVMRSQIHFADYNPRTIVEDNTRTLKRGIRKFGLVGGIVINKRTDNTIVSGHQRISVMDDLHKYNPETGENDYALRVDVVDLPIKEEKELNILSNNPNAQGSWDFDKMRQLIPDIDYRDAGLTDADLDMIGVDFIFQTEQENAIGNAIDYLVAPVVEQRQAEAEMRRRAREAQREMDAEPDSGDDEPDAEKTAANVPAPTPEMTRQQKIDHMKQVKQTVSENARATAQNADAYIVLSFDDWAAKAKFCRAFGFDEYDKFVKGETFASRFDIYDDDEE